MRGPERVDELEHDRPRVESLGREAQLAGLHAHDVDQIANEPPLVLACAILGHRRESCGSGVRRFERRVCTLGRDVLTYVKVD